MELFTSLLLITDGKMFLSNNKRAQSQRVNMNINPDCPGLNWEIGKVVLRHPPPPNLYMFDHALVKIIHILFFNTKFLLNEVFFSACHKSDATNSKVCYL